MTGPPNHMTDPQRPDPRQPHSDASWGTVKRRAGCLAGCLTEPFVFVFLILGGLLGGYLWSRKPRARKSPDDQTPAEDDRG